MKILGKTLRLCNIINNTSSPISHERSTTIKINADSINGASTSAYHNNKYNTLNSWSVTGEILATPQQCLEFYNHIVHDEDPFDIDFTGTFDDRIFSIKGKVFINNLKISATKAQPLSLKFSAEGNGAPAIKAFEPLQ